ncbi:nucleotide disphospho-sugar-binding domain-containing protein [Kitasatospora viridis]|uniref:DNA helicase IV n=1 Tax=Kitasatospora viridis TaxID=281105 RepID=A0A561T729_9ACTN|nr:nucleotide disphospho-sugar-binding domain-containing protein [Kitasatospora viridis]TWF82921.1 DNA helicase IV [Kitasatospora viridis]
MRVLLATYGSRGDVEPMLALAVRLREAGAQVRVCAPPEQEFAERLAGAGVELVPLGRPWHEMVRPSGKDAAARMVADLIEEQHGTLAAAAEGCDLLVATGMVLFSAPSVAEALGIRYVFTAFCPVVLPSPDRAPLPGPGGPYPPEETDVRVLRELEAQGYNDRFGAAVGAHRAALGLPPVASVRDHVFTDQPWLAADPVLGPWQPTPELDVVQTGAWHLPDERPLPADLVEFLAAGEPPVYVGFGSMRHLAPDLAQVAVEAVRAQGRRVLLGRGWAGLAAADDRGDCFVVGEVNQQELFRRVAAVVHHGGAGTLFAAALAGAPQVVLPQAADQPYYAERVAELGIGAAHDGPVPTVESLSAALAAALAPEVRTRAAAVAARIRTDGAERAARRLVELIAADRKERELRAENAYVGLLYDRLDLQRELAGDRLREVHRQERGGTAQSRMERDTMESTHTRRIAELHAAEYGLCFGRIEDADGERQYIGRIALADDDHEPLLTDWRARAAEPFYRATPARPGGVVARRHLRSKGRAVVDFDDDAFGLDDQESSGGEGALSGEGALLASLTARRTGRMGDIVATIQAEQDRVIRSDLAGVLVVQGGPGTGKTVVALHRAAYLLYTHRDRLAKRGVLVIGPNTTFLRYIDQVLPALGETEVVLGSIGTLYPGVTGVTGADGERAEVAAVKGDARMAQVLLAALDGLRQLPEEEWTITVGRSSGHRQELRISRALGERAHAAAHRTHEPHNQARAALVERVSSELALRIARDRDGEMDLDAVADLADSLVEEPEFQQLAERLWPVLTAEQLVTALYGSPELAAAADLLGAEERELLRREPGAPWTEADVPVLDEAAELLGPVPGSAATLPRDGLSAAELEYAKHLMESFDASMVDIETSLVDVEVLARQYRGTESLRPLSERAAADRTWAYGHVIVDEAQELSPMAWRMLTRRCPGRSMTIVGDLAQTGAPAGLNSWGQALDEYTAGRWRSVELSVNYRTPSEIMRTTEGVLRALDTGLAAPRAVRSGGVRPWSRQVAPDELRAVVEKEIAAMDGGRMAIVHPEGLPVDALASLAGVVAAGEPSALDSPVVLMTPGQSKGLEFDSVLLLEPARMLAAHTRGLNDLYVALTRATKTLGVLHTEELPAVLEGFEER